MEAGSTANTRMFTSISLVVSIHNTLVVCEIHNTSPRTFSCGIPASIVLSCEIEFPVLVVGEESDRYKLKRRREKYLHFVQ